MINVQTLAYETPYTAEEWQLAIDRLGKDADKLLRVVRNICSKQGTTPDHAAWTVLQVMGS